MGLPQWLSSKESTCNPGVTGDMGLIPVWGRSPGGVHGNPLQSSCLENAMDRGAWQAAVHRVTKNQTWRKRLSSSSSSRYSVGMGFPGSSVGKNLPAKAGDLKDAGLIFELGRSPGGEHGNPLQYSCLENPHKQRRLVDYSLCGHKKSHTTEQLSAQHIFVHVVPIQMN